MTQNKPFRYSSCILFLFFILLVGCSKAYEYKTDGPFVTALISPGGPDDFRNLISSHIAIYEDGTLVLSEDGSNKTDKPIWKSQIEQKEIEKLKEIIEDNEFQKLEDDVTSPSDDGSRYNITVNFVDGSKKVEGWNPVNEQFNTIHRYVFSLVDDKDYTKWRTEIEEYKWEEHSLYTNTKDEYKENGPFFTLLMENKFSNDDDHIYFTQVSLDLDGNLLLSVEDERNRVIEDIKPMKKKLTKEEIASFQKVILDHFWKLNENQRDANKNLMEEMTVHMTDEKKTVEGHEPDHPRYVIIKDKIFDLIGTDVYESWLDSVEEYLVDHYKEPFSFDDLLKRSQ